MTSTAANNNRVTTADWRARIETKLDLLTTQVGDDLSEAKKERRGQSQRLDRVELAIAEMKAAKRERAHIEEKADKAQAGVDALKTEQRIWASANTVLGPLAAAVTAWLGGNQ